MVDWASKKKSLNQSLHGHIYIMCSEDNKSQFGARPVSTLFFLLMLLLLLLRLEIEQIKKLNLMTEDIVTRDFSSRRKNAAKFEYEKCRIISSSAVTFNLVNVLFPILFFYNYSLRPAQSLDLIS